MGDLDFIEDGFRHDQMLEGLREAAYNYGVLVEEVGEDAMARREGLTDNEIKVARRYNQDVFVPDALRIPEDTQVIMATEGFNELRPQCAEDQYAIDHFVGEAVARNLFAVVNSAEAREVLPDRTVALFEVNANRGFPRGEEDDLGCYGLPSDWLGYIAVDLNYLGSDELAKRNLEKMRIDYLGEPGAWTTLRLDPSIERNAARIRIRPARPIENRRAYSIYPMPRDVFEKRAGLSEEEVDSVYPEWSVLSGQFRICRAVCLLHDLTDWSPDDFIGKVQDIEAEMKAELRLAGPGSVSS